MVWGLLLLYILGICAAVVVGRERQRRGWLWGLLGPLGVLLILLLPPGGSGRRGNERPSGPMPPAVGPSEPAE